MLESKNLLGNMKLFEELNNQVSENISGGASVEALVDELDLLKILDGDLQQKINKRIKELFPKGLGAKAALACVTKNGLFSCQVSSNGQTKDFNVPL